MRGSADINSVEHVDLIERCQQGDTRAQREFVDSRANQVYRWAVLLGLRPKDAEDASQEVLLTALRRIGSCRPAAATCWLYQITRRVVANYRRRVWLRRVLLSGEEPEQAAFLPQQSLGMEQEIDLRRCLGCLPPKLAEVLVLVDIEGFTREEVAVMLDIPDGTAASRLRLAREAFRARWHGDASVSTSRLSWREP